MNKGKSKSQDRLAELVAEALPASVVQELPTKLLIEEAGYTAHEIAYELSGGLHATVCDIVADSASYGTVVYEYDGEQHYRAVGRMNAGPADMAKQRSLDEEKDTVLARIGIPLVRIPYDTYVDADVIKRKTEEAIAARDAFVASMGTCPSCGRAFPVHMLSRGMCRWCLLEEDVQAKDDGGHAPFNAPSQLHGASRIGGGAIAGGTGALGGGFAEHAHGSGFGNGMPSSGTALDGVGAINGSRRFEGGDGIGIAGPQSLGGGSAKLGGRSFDAHGVVIRDSGSTMQGDRTLHGTDGFRGTSIRQDGGARSQDAPARFRNGVTPVNGIGMQGGNSTLGRQANTLGGAAEHVHGNGLRHDGAAMDDKDRAVTTISSSSTLGSTSKAKGAKTLSGGHGSLGGSQLGEHAGKDGAGTSMGSKRIGDAGTSLRSANALSVSRLGSDGSRETTDRGGNANAGKAGNLGVQHMHGAGIQGNRHNGIRNVPDGLAGRETGNRVPSRNVLGGGSLKPTGAGTIGSAANPSWEAGEKRKSRFSGSSLGGNATSGKATWNAIGGNQLSGGMPYGDGRTGEAGGKRFGGGAHGLHGLGGSIGTGKSRLGNGGGLGGKPMGGHRLHGNGYGDGYCEPGIPAGITHDGDETDAADAVVESDAVVEGDGGIATGGCGARVAVEATDGICGTGHADAVRQGNPTDATDVTVATDATGPGNTTDANDATGPGNTTDATDHRTTSGSYATRATGGTAGDSNAEPGACDDRGGCGGNGDHDDGDDDDGCDAHDDHDDDGESGSHAGSDRHRTVPGGNGRGLGGSGIGGGSRLGGTGSPFAGGSGNRIGSGGCGFLGGRGLGGSRLGGGKLSR